MFLLKLNLVGVFFYFCGNIGIMENCRATNEQLLHSTTTRALAVMKGNFNGSAISGVVKFFQNVIPKTKL